MKGNELELWKASLLTKCNFIKVQSNRLMLSVTNIAQFLQPLLSVYPLLSGNLGRSRRCPFNRGFTVHVMHYNLSYVQP